MLALLGLIGLVIGTLWAWYWVGRDLPPNNDATRASDDYNPLGVTWAALFGAEGQRRTRRTRCGSSVLSSN